MSEKATLEQVGPPDKIVIVEGLVFEDKFRIKTQRRLEKHFNLPIQKIFAGSAKNAQGKIEKWDGVDFNFLDNVIPLLTILAQQVDDTVTEAKVEEILDNCNTSEVTKAIEKYFMNFKAKAAANPTTPTKR